MVAIMTTGPNEILLNYNVCRFGNMETLARLHFYLSYYCGVPSLILGFPGNLLIILIANRRHNKHISASVYMQAMAVVDTIVVVVAVFHIPFLHSRVGEDSKDVQYM
jgi:hypothetical protein